MNYELAVMALDGLSRSPIRIGIEEEGIEIAGEPASFKELARLLLLLGGDDVDEGERIDLSPGIHLDPRAPKLVVKVERSKIEDR